MQRYVFCAIVIILTACDVNTLDGPAIYTDFFEVYPIQLSEETLQGQPKLRRAYAAYQVGDYKTVVDVTGNFTRNDARLPLSMMALAMGYMKLDSLDEAYKTLSVLEAHPVIGDEASWYKALIAIKRNQFSKADTLLQASLRKYDPIRIAQADSVYVRLNAKNQ